MAVPPNPAASAAAVMTAVMILRARDMSSPSPALCGYALTISLQINP